jgi:uncharacterized protein (DUF2267 family)
MHATAYLPVMTAEELYERVEAHAPAGGLSTKKLVREVLSELAERLTPEEAAELGVALPESLGNLLAAANGDGHLERDEFIETIAARLDLDDDEAEARTLAVLVALRELLEAVVAVDQVLAILPPDLAQMMSE